MRRKEREITDIKKIDEILRSCDCCRIALCDGENAPYIVPMSFGFERTDAGCYFYFHGARSGRKLELMDRNPNVGFELDTAHEIIAGAAACDYTTHYQSVTGAGKLEALSSEADRLHALDCIMEHYVPGTTWIYDEKVLNATNILCLTVTEMNCKVYE